MYRCTLPPYIIASFVLPIPDIKLSARGGIGAVANPCTIPSKGNSSSCILCIATSKTLETICIVPQIDVVGVKINVIDFGGIFVMPSKQQMLEIIKVYFQKLFRFFYSIDMIRKRKDLNNMKYLATKFVIIFIFFFKFSVVKASDVKITIFSANKTSEYSDLLEASKSSLMTTLSNNYEIVDGIGRYSMLHGPTKATRGKYLTEVKGKKMYARIIIRKIK